LGGWTVFEYEHPTARIKGELVPGFNEAEKFRRERKELYVAIGLDAVRGFSQAQPEISKSEIDLFTRIVENPELLDHVMRCFNL